MARRKLEEDDELMNELLEGVGTHDEPVGAVASSYVAPVSDHVPLWDGSRSANANTRLRVQRVTLDGVTEDLGYLPFDSGQEHLVSRFPKAGVYNLMPVDEFGRNRRGDPIRVVIPEDHPVLRSKLAAATATAAIPSNHGMQLPTELAEILKMQVMEANKRAEAALDLARQSAELLAKEREKLAQERMQLSVQTTNTAMDLQAQLVERSQRRDDMATNQMVSMFAAQQAAQEAAFHRMMELQKAEREAERLRWERQVAEEKARLEAEKQERRDRLDREAKELELKMERERQEAEKRNKQDREMFEERLQQNQAFFERMASLHKQQGDPIAQLVNTTSRLEPLGDLLGGLFGLKKGTEEPAGPKGIAEVVGGLAEKYLQMQIEMARAQAAMAAQQQPQIPMYDQVEEFDDDDEDDEGEDGPEEAQAPPTLAAQAPANLTFEEVISQRAKDVPPTVQKAARLALRGLINELKSSDQSEWMGKIILTFQGTPDAVAYLRAVGIRTAAREAGADDNTAASIVVLVDNTGLVPQDIPRY